MNTPADPTRRRPGGDRRIDDTDRQKPRMPHERDQSSDSQESAPREVLEQAYRDIEQGQQDTDRRGTRGFEKPENRILHDREQRGKRVPDRKR